MKVVQDLTFFFEDYKPKIMAASLNSVVNIN